MPRLDQPASAVLISGGLDSAILCVDLLREYPRVVPLYIRSGLRWEASEIAALNQFLSHVEAEGLDGLIVLDEPIAEVYGSHWSTDGRAVPGSETADEAVYLPGRNLLLTVKAAIWCRLRGIRALALGSLGSNPFPDSTPDFFRKLEDLLNQAMGGDITTDSALRLLAQGRSHRTWQRPTPPPDVLLHQPDRRSPLRCL